MTEGQSTPQWPAALLAEAAGETSEQLAWYADAGLLVTTEDGGYAADSLHRLRLIRHARQRGVTDEDLALATKTQGDLLGLFDEFTEHELRSYNLVEEGDRVGIPRPLLEELLRLLNLDDEAEVVRRDDVNALQLLKQALDLGLPEDALTQLIRVFADCTERLADAQVRIFHDYVHEQFRASGMTGPELLQATDAISRPALELVEPAILYFHRRAWQTAMRDDFLRHLAEATTPPSATPGDAIAAVMFVDLAGFTPLTLALGDRGVAEVIDAFTALVRPAASRHGGRIIKQIGDAFMLVFTRPDDAVRFGVEIAEAADRATELPALHIGAHFGQVLYRDGDYYGNAVNLAARVASASDPGQFLVTDALADAVGDAVVGFDPLPPRPLKGVAEPPSLLAVSR